MVLISDCEVSLCIVSVGLDAYASLVACSKLAQLLDNCVINSFS